MVLTEIYLANGRGVVTVDPHRYKELSRYSWRLHKGKYAKTNVDSRGNKTVCMHQLVCPGVGYVDHINGNTLDNRESNLRRVDNQRNQANRSIGKNNTSGFKGVRKEPKENLTKPYRADIKVNGSMFYIGHYLTAEEAALGYNEVASEFYGIYAKLNHV